MNPLTTMQRIRCLSEEIVLLKSRLLDHDTGHIHTAINVLIGRLVELEQQELEEQKQRNL
jgi:hypothetical protein